jgi:Tfp pilus assembly protein PilV
MKRNIRIVIKKITCRLKQNAGESLSEVLVAMLVIALAMVLLVSMVMAARNLSDISADRFERGMNLSNSIESGKTDYNTSANSENAVTVGSVDSNLSISEGKIKEFSQSHVYYPFTYQANGTNKISVPVRLEEVTQNGTAEYYLYSSVIQNQNQGSGQ